MPERVFWHEMNPKRLIALFDAHFGRLKPRRGPTVDTQAGEELGLYSAISRMGGL